MEHLFLWLRRKLKLRKLYFLVFSSIAFYPAAISLSILMLAFFFMYLDSLGLSYKMLTYIPYIVTHDTETARSLLSTLASGILSLMVFSFSMVMVVLTMASNNYTPRVLPGLVNDKSHQVVLGIYLGTIGYIIVVLINIHSQAYDFSVPVLSVLISVLLAFSSLVAFVYFIHSISQNIQIGNILENLFQNTRKSFQEALEQPFVEQISNDSGWYTVESRMPGYFQGMDNKVTVELAQEEDMQVLVLAEKGVFLTEGSPMLRVSKPLNEESTSKLQQQASYYQQEHISVNYLYGFKHITEVAVKAMSPGINDPGTAINAIDYLTQLFIDALKIGSYRVFKDEKGQVRLLYKQVQFHDIFYLSFSSIRNYASGDVAVQQRLLKMLDTLEQRDKEQRYRKLFEQERKAILINAGAKLENEKDKTMLERNSK